MTRNPSPRRKSQVIALMRARRTEDAQDGTVLLLLLMSLLLALFLVAPAEAADLVCGRDILVRPLLREIPHGDPLPRVDFERKAGGTDIVLNPGPGLTARPAALAAWNQAVTIWEAVLDDPITIEIDGDFAALGAGTLGSTQPTAFGAGYSTVRNAIVNDAENGESAAQTLPTAAQKQIDMPPGFSDGGSVIATKANFQALGFDMSFNTDPDASMVFSTGFESQFDYDPSDGIDAGKYDFVAIVVHEIGHALGFASMVDIIDFYRSNSQTATVSPYALDLFRIAPGGSDSWSTAARCLNTGDLEASQNLFDGSIELSMSTGVELGDGRQASHWKADELSGSFLGIMDPTLAPGQHEELQQSDVDAIGLIGWDVLPLDQSTPAPAFGPAARLSAHPNPFNPRTTIEFTLANPAQLQLDIYDMAGRHVRELHRGRLDAGSYALIWDGRDDAGRRLASGVYFARALAGDAATRTKLVLVQ